MTGMILPVNPSTNASGGVKPSVFIASGIAYRASKKGAAESRRTRMELNKSMEFTPTLKVPVLQDGQTQQNQYQVSIPVLLV